MSKDMDDAIRRAAGHGMRRPDREREEEPQAPAPGSFEGGVRKTLWQRPAADGNEEFRAMYRAFRRHRATGPYDYWPEDAA